MTEATHEDAPSKEQGEVETPEETTPSGNDDTAKTELTPEQKKIIQLKDQLKGKDKEIDQLKSSDDKSSNDSKESNIDNKSGEPNYYNSLMVKTFLKSEGIDHPDDQEMVLKEAKRLKLQVDELVGEDYIKSRLKDAKDQRSAQESMPKGNQPSGGEGRSQIDYWIDRKNKDGSFQNPKDPELHQKVINARMERDKKDQMFDEIRV